MGVEVCKVYRQSAQDGCDSLHKMGLTLRRQSYAARLENLVQLQREHSDNRHPCKQRFYKVLPDMRCANSSAYEPNFFRLGLYNVRFDDCIAPCDYYKSEIATALTTDATFKGLVSSLEAQMPNISMLYGDAWDMEYASERPQEVAFILALDSLTVIAAACYQDYVKPRSMCAVIWRDAFLMEQQLPLFVLQAAIDSIALDAQLSASVDVQHSASCCSSGFAYAKSRPQIHDVVNFYALKTSYPFIRNYVQMLKERPCPQSPPLDMQQSLLSRIHTSFIHSHNNVHRVVSTQFTSLPTASKLRAYGIQFAVGDGGFTGINFDRKSRVLTLPEITVFNTTKSFLLNLVAQEAAISWYDDDQCPVSSYILLMNNLINAEEDVRILVDAQVVHNHLGSHAELAAMWNSLCINLPISLTYEDSMVINTVRGACRLCNAVGHCQRNKRKLSQLLINSVSSWCR